MSKPSTYISVGEHMNIKFKVKSIWYQNVAAEPQCPGSHKVLHCIPFNQFVIGKKVLTEKKNS